MVRSLSHRQQLEEEKQRRQHQHTQGIIHTKFPWIVQNNSLPNYFLSHNKDGAKYSDSVVVFMHQPRAAGLALRECMETIALQRSLAMSPVLTDSGRRDWENGVGTGNDALKNRVDIHRGNFAFGVCDTVTKPCSYFIMMREPWLRALSSYRYCKTALADEWCSGENANKMSLREWIVHQGSVLFRLLIYSSHFCHSLDGGATSTNKTNNRHLPCWFVQKQRIADLTNSDKHTILDYVLENLEKWFSVIGIYEEFEDSIKLFEETLTWPMTMCRSLQPRKYSFSSRERRENSVLFLPETEVASLKEDPAVKAALEADEKIYKKAKSIFSRQRQILFNKVGKGR
ncbi:uncharacterized protein LOC135503258 isoform X2 [Lineus longissimus]